MPRKQKRKRDPDRSHGRGPVVALVPRHLAHSPPTMQGAGWTCTRLTPHAAERLCSLLSSTRPTGPAWHPHNAPGQQGNDLPLLQRALLGSSAWAKWQPAVRETLSELHELLCPECGRAISSHQFVSCDLNRVRPKAALWPHVDKLIGDCRVVLLVMLQPAAIGGHFRVARREGVAWRDVDGASALARRERDTVVVPLRECGDVCVISGMRMVHEVTKVSGPSDRFTMAFDLRCCV